MSENSPPQPEFCIHPVGYVRRLESGIRLEIFELYRPALKNLGPFSHVLVLWWANQRDNDEHRRTLQVCPPYPEAQLSGVFATRSPSRPNPIAVTVCQILAVDEENGIVQIANIDAFDGTPILDLKVYIPASDRVRDAHIAEWLKDWPEWLPDEGLGLRE